MVTGISIFNYPGKKLGYLHSHIYDKLYNGRGQKGSTILVEPFCGSGSVSLNCTKLFEKVYASDYNPHLIAIFNAFSIATYSEYLRFFTEYVDKYDLLTKEGYYAFREEINTNFWNTSSIEEGFGIYVLANCCINSIVRFGPNGFNQGFGNNMEKFKGRISQIAYYNLQTVCQRVSWETCDFIKQFEKFGQNSKVCWFIDPPYNDTASIYGGMDRKKFLNELTKLKGAVLYTDTLSDDIIEGLPGWTMTPIREMRTIRPHAEGGKPTKTEVIYTNFK